ncbi:MAG: CRISPR-associated endonuclease Cas2 [Lentisphaeria bacterium]|nr:CRISPR-associated endonuclease Cas2 [Lentisphaeria bacterium]
MQTNDLYKPFESPLDWANRYFPAEELDELPSDKEPRNMLHLIAYDIADPSRLRKIAKVCELYGVRIEKSVFEADLSEENYQAFWLELMDLIDENEDAVIAYRICKNCIRQTEMMGRAQRPRRIVCYFI